MNKSKFSLIALIAMGITSYSYAVAPGFYVGGQAGGSNLHNKNQTITVNSASVLATPANTGFGIRFFGGYQYTYFGVETGLTAYARSKYSNSLTVGTPSITTYAWDVVGKGLWVSPVGLGVYGKAGFAVASLGASGSIVGGPSGIKPRPTAGFGVTFDFAQNWVGEVSFSRIFAAGGTTMQNADLAALGITYHFVDEYCGQFLC
ncbi:MAG: hypothetical protein A3J38_00660 [Gammaproteobacteria bacterium RIFCSPHIGHO2_12_FULL_45_9]|nr:MAG: hypothetical protein A3J38_00660 [Gammaproteobacteria bacterium RIFCSPHIGHO2_12_FULL_45_9]